MPEVTVDIQVWCSCGEGLCNQAEGGNGDITVEPCEKCLGEARKTSYEEGYEEGLEGSEE